MKILLVDDEVELVSTLAERMTMRGIDADWAQSPAQAMEKVGSEAYDLAVLDVKMPGMSGLELKRKLADIAPDMKYIFITGHGSSADFKEGSAEGSSYLVKPVALDLLMEKIREALSETA
ncbi:response regulator [Desulfovibrio inopinatus]|uniref:response regulator n=1 Tax=Desulfovibrio inopinatus TaxID=102109 RepID=UPI000407C879|nr:response regulator [Desulfovibrio inopinatus]